MPNYDGSSPLYPFIFWVDFWLCKFGKCLGVYLLFRKCLGFIATSCMSWSNSWISFLIDLHFLIKLKLNLSFLIWLWSFYPFYAQTFWVASPSSLHFVRNIGRQLEQILLCVIAAPRATLPLSPKGLFWFSSKPFWSILMVLMVLAKITNQAKSASTQDFYSLSFTPLRSSIRSFNLQFLLLDFVVRLMQFFD